MTNLNLSGFTEINADCKDCLLADLTQVCHCMQAALCPMVLDCVAGTAGQCEQSQYHLAPAGAGTCDYGAPIFPNGHDLSECSTANRIVAAAYNHTPGRNIQSGCWSWLPTNYCFTQSSHGDWTAHMSYGCGPGRWPLPNSGYRFICRLWTASPTAPTASPTTGPGLQVGGLSDGTQAALLLLVLPVSVFILLVWCCLFACRWLKVSQLNALSQEEHIINLKLAASRHQDCDEKCLAFECVPPKPHESRCRTCGGSFAQSFCCLGHLLWSVPYYVIRANVDRLCCVNRNKIDMDRAVEEDNRRRELEQEMNERGVLGLRQCSHNTKGL